ncbi:hypothetical protein AWN76_012985 [Rhodothermaceae bacterium RA]|nr:hypothetical protein AWN76_012985 [Rhodothermaceae bacterium RA]
MDRGARMPSTDALPTPLSPLAYERLLAISVRLNATRDMDDLLPFIIDTAADVLDCEAASLLLYDEEAGQLRFAAATGADLEAIRRIPVPLDGSLAGRIFTDNEVVLVDDVAAADDHYEEVGRQVGFQTRSLLGVPMCLDGRPTGVLEALNKRGGSFSESDVEVLSILAAHAAIAIRNARQMQFVQEAYDRLQAFDRFRASFLSIAAHELRTPLTVMLGSLGLLQEEAPPTLQAFVEDAMAAGARMKEVLETMAQMELLNGGVVLHEAAPIDVRALLRTVREAFAAEAAAGGLTLRLLLPADPLWIRGDAEQLRQVVSNLLKNAIQFTPESGTITLRAGQDEARVHIAVQDTGIGLPGAVLDRIFDEFYQVEDYLTRTHGGLGLGLTIARKLAELHGGRLWAASDGPGCGTTLHLVLPALADPA